MLKGWIHLNLFCPAVCVSLSLTFVCAVQCTRACVWPLSISMTVFSCNRTYDLSLLRTTADGNPVCGGFQMMPNDNKVCVRKRVFVCLWFVRNALLTIRTGITAYAANVWCNPLLTDSFMAFFSSVTNGFHRRCGFVGFRFVKSQAFQIWQMRAETRAKIKIALGSMRTRKIPTSNFNRTNERTSLLLLKSTAASRKNSKDN